MTGSDAAPASLERYYRAFLRLWCVGSVLAAFAQLASTEHTAAGSAWGYAPGWQREIGFWNIALVALLVAILRRGSTELHVAATRALVLLSALFAVNHLVEVFRGGQVHALQLNAGAGAINSLSVVFGGTLLVATWLRARRGDRR